MVPAPARQWAARLSVVLAVVLAAAVARPAEEIVISEPGHYTDNRGWNDAGIVPAYQIVVTATVAPSGSPTRVFAEQGDVRQALWHFPLSTAPHTYVSLRSVTSGGTGPWQIVAERSGARSAVWTPGLAAPQEVPLARNVRVVSGGPHPRVSWQLPDLTGFDIDRIRVGIRGGKRLYERFMDLVYISGDLPATATTFTVPASALARGERYIFQVMLEDLENGALENRSSAFSALYTVPR